MKVKRVILALLAASLVGLGVTAMASPAQAFRPLCVGIPEFCDDYQPTEAVKLPEGVRCHWGSMGMYDCIPRGV